MDDKRPGKNIVFTLVLEKDSGDVISVSNLQPEELPLLYRALRLVEERMFAQIETMLPRIEEPVVPAPKTTPDTLPTDMALV